MHYPLETKQKFHHLGLWFVIAFWAARATSTSSNLDVMCQPNQHNTCATRLKKHVVGCVVKHTCGNVHKQFSKIVKCGMIGMVSTLCPTHETMMFTETHAEKHADI